MVETTVAVIKQKFCLYFNYEQFCLQSGMLFSFSDRLCLYSFSLMVESQGV